MLSCLFEQEGEQVHYNRDNREREHHFLVSGHRRASFILAKSEASRRNLQSVPLRTIYGIRRQNSIHDFRDEMQREARAAALPVHGAFRLCVVRGACIAWRGLSLLIVLFAVALRGRTLPKAKKLPRNFCWRTLQPTMAIARRQCVRS